MGDIDLRNLDRWAAEGPPHDFFARLREDSPLWRHPGVDGSPGFWVVSGYEQVSVLGRCPHALSSDAGNGGVTGLGPGDELQAAFDAAEEELFGATLGNDVKMLLSLDPPEHTEYRKVLNRLFTPGAVSELTPTVTDLARSLLDRLDDVIDFTTDVAMPLPMQVIGDLLGAPRETHQDLLRWSNEAVAGTDPEYLPDGGSSLAAAMSLAQLFAVLRMEREANPTGDLVSALLAGRINGEPMSGLRFMMYMLLLTTAGNETTRNAMSHGVWALRNTQNNGNACERTDRSSIRLSKRFFGGRVRCCTSAATR
ncbi:MAG: hypothetical protein R2735_10660 [Microthrixaceae bacterium]